MRRLSYLGCLIFSATGQPISKITRPGLMEHEKAFSPLGPAATGAPVGTSGGAGSPAYSRGGIR